MVHVSVLAFFAEARSSSGCADTQSQAILGRDYLNGLVEASVASVDSQVRKTARK